MSGRRLAVALALMAASFGVAELMLRLLPLVGVPLERWSEPCFAREPESPLNHAPRPGTVRLHMGSPALFGDAGEREYDEVWDAHGIKRSALRPQAGDGVRVLFMGDSFMQGYDDANTIPQRAWEWVSAQPDAPAPLIFLNAGFTSYSPTIYTAQAKRLLPALKPDFVVIDIDETDLFDDAVRYRGLEQRDADGGIVAIGQPADLASAKDGMAWAACLPSQVLRLTATLYYRLHLTVFEWRQARRNEELFAVSGTPEADLTPALRERMQYFAGTLDELIATVKRFLPADRILIVYHPHRWQLTSSNHGPSWNRQVSALIGAAARRGDVAFFDAHDDLEKRFAGHAERYYWPNDMHFNFDGMRAYGELIGRELLRLIDHEHGAG